MTDIIIEEIIKRLTPLRTLYSEIDPLISNLKKHKFDDLDRFIERYYHNVFYSLEFKEFVSELQNKFLLKKDYMSYFKNENNYYKVVDFYLKNSICINGFTAINVNNEEFNRLKNINNSKTKVKNNEKENDNDTELLSSDCDDIVSIRKKLLEAQLNYITKPTDFIESLEHMNEMDIYNNLLNLGNISYIQHCISNLDIDILEKLLIYVKNKELIEHSLINIFIEEAIKRNIHLKKNSLKK